MKISKLRRMRCVVRELAAAFKEHRISFVGGQIAYFFILSVFPFLIFANSLIASFHISAADAISFLSPVLPERVVSFIASYLGYVNAQSTASLISTGIVIAVFSASKSVRSLVAAFNLAYGVKPERSFFADIAFSMLFIVLFGAVLFAGILFVAFGNDFISGAIARLSIPFAFADVLALWRWGALSLLFFAVMLLLYRVLPKHKMSFSKALPGAVFALAGFLVFTSAFSLYVNVFMSPYSFYGSLGAVMLFMLWMYFAGIITVLGAELNRILENLDS